MTLRMTMAENPTPFATAPPAERRERRAVSLRGFVVAPGGIKTEAQLLDLSYDGCRIATELALEPGQSVSLAVARLGVIEAEVRWAADGKAGLVFAAEQPAQRPHTPRGKERKPLVAEIVVRRVGQANYRLGVRDLSPSGCMINVVDRPRVGEPMMVKFDGLETLEAEVCWVKDYDAGLRFVREIHPAVFGLLLARLQG